MKIISTLIFFFSVFGAHAQWQDAFDDGEISSSPSWIGDTSDFLVNSSLQLQLNAAAAGHSAISTLSSPNMFSDLEWRFFVHQNFSPSSGNYGRVYLVSDQPDLTGPLNGYYLQFGESLSNDAVELFRQDGLNSVSVCRATDAAISSAFSIAVRVTRDNIGLWSLWIDYTGGSNYVLECYGAEAMYTGSAYFGIFCEYTGANLSKFYYDDIYVGPLLQDTIPPVITSLIPISENILELRFSEAMDQASANTISNYSLDAGLGNPLSALLNSTDPTLVTLTFSGSFISSFQHTLTVQGLKDLAENLILPGAGAVFTYYAPVTVMSHDIIFTEIMFEPSSSSALPNVEFVEIYNRRTEAVSLENWSISDGASTAILPQHIILPHSYLLLCNSNVASTLSPYGEVLGLSSFPVLNNDAGDRLQLFDNNNILIEEISFSNSTYRDGNKDDGGYSLERIDTSFLCIDPLNWRASASALGGTPGQGSSVADSYLDKEKPVLIRAFVIDSVHVGIVFSEAMVASNLFNSSLYSVFGNGQSSIHPDSITATSDPAELIMRLPFSVGEDIYQLSINYGLKDCPGNDLDISRTIRFAIPKKVEPGDIVINEILFDPLSGGSDFVELYNRSNKVLDLMRWRIAEAPYQEYSLAQASKSICDKPQLIFPGEFICLTSNTSDIRQRYENPGIMVFLAASELPDFNSIDGAAVIYDSLGIVLDQLSYSEEMHFPLLISKKGVSLERLSPEINGDATSNWHSASSSSGFATPGFKNSIGWINSEIDDGLSIEPSVFTPDNDGTNDVLFIRLRQSDSQGIARVLIFDIAGNLVRELTKQVIIGDEYAVVWDGLRDSGEPAAIGTYIVCTETFSPDGHVKRKKLPCALSLN